MQSTDVEPDLSVSARPPVRIGSFPLKPGRNLILKNIRIGNHRTSIRLEPTMWEALDDVCRRERVTLNDVCTKIASVCEGSLTSAIRAFLIDYYRGIAAREGGARVAVPVQDR